MTFADDLKRALERRAPLLDQQRAEGTDCVRLFHGAIEGRPGLTIDRYGPVLLVQTFRDPLAPGELEEIALGIESAGIEGLTAVWNHRGDKLSFGEHSPDPGLVAPLGQELGLSYDVRPRHRGRDPLLFLDLRAGRRRVRAEAEGKTVLNLFAYTCGIGLAAAAGGAKEALNVDFAGSALTVGHANAERNGVAAAFATLEEDFFPAARQLAGLPIKGRGARRKYTKLEPRTFDLVVLDPPRWSKGPFGAVDVVRDYASLFKPALLATAEGGSLLVTNHVAHVDEVEWHEGLRRAVKKVGRAIAELEPLRPDADFPSPDEQWPLKMAWLTLA